MSLTCTLSPVAKCAQQWRSIKSCHHDFPAIIGIQALCCHLASKVIKCRPSHLLPRHHHSNTAASRSYERKHLYESYVCVFFWYGQACLFIGYIVPNPRSANPNPVKTSMLHTVIELSATAWSGMLWWRLVSVEVWAQQFFIIIIFFLFHIIMTHSHMTLNLTLRIRVVERCHVCGGPKAHCSIQNTHFLLQWYHKFWYLINISS